MKLGTAEAPDGPDDLYRSFEAFEVAKIWAGESFRRALLHFAWRITI